MGSCFTAEIVKVKLSCNRLNAVAPLDCWLCFTGSNIVLVHIVCIDSFVLLGSSVLHSILLILQMMKVSYSSWEFSRMQSEEVKKQRHILLKLSCQADVFSAGAAIVETPTNSLKRTGRSLNFSELQPSQQLQWPLCHSLLRCHIIRP